MGLWSRLENYFTISVLKNKLKKLESLDQELKIFGARSHQYKINDVLTKEEILKFENENGILLPEEYRQYLQKVGDGGAGPFWGLYPLGEGDGNIVDLAKPFEWSRGNPLVMEKFYEEIPESISDEEHEQLLENFYKRANQGIVFWLQKDVEYIVC